MLKKIKSCFEECGGQHTRETFDGELNYESGKLFFLIVVAIFVWIPFIPLDISTHSYPIFAVSTKVALSVLSICAVILKFFKPFNTKPKLLLMIVTSYILITSALVTGMSVDPVNTHITLYIVAVMIPIGLPLSLKFKSSIILLMFAIYLVTAILFGRELYRDMPLWAATIFSLFFSYILNRLRYIAWEQRIEISRLARKEVDFYRRMAHELLTPLTKVSVGIQESIKFPQETTANLKEAQAEIMAISNKINNALDESENRGDE